MRAPTFNDATILRDLLVSAYAHLTVLAICHPHSTALADALDAVDDALRALPDSPQFSISNKAHAFASDSMRRFP